MKRSIITGGLLSLVVSVVILGIVPLQAQDPAQDNVEKMFKEIKSELAEIKKDLAEVKAMIAELRPVAPDTPDTPEPKEWSAAEKQGALELTAKWYDALTERDIEAIMSEMDVPFALEDEIIETEEDLREMVEEEWFEEDIDEFSGARYDIIESLDLHEDEQKIIDRILPKGGIFIRVTISKGKDEDSIILAVRPGDNPKIVGLAD